MNITSLRKAARKGDLESIHNLGVAYAIGKGVPKNNKRAAQLYRKVAEKGEAFSQYNLAWLYSEGLGVPQDNKQAIKWYRKAAEQGMVAAQYNLGCIYYSVYEDEEQGYQWVLKAAEAGDDDAMNMLIAKGRMTPSLLDSQCGMLRFNMEDL